jgi:GH24 family phage-related lysozyme (muramidase)
MYLDIAGLVTTGIGNLIDPVDHALALPWVFKGTTDAAAEVDVRNDWQAVKAVGQGKTRAELMKITAAFYAPLTRLELTDDAIDRLVLAKADTNEASLKGTPEFAAFDAWPADAQLGLMSVAWAQGTGFAKWPKFRAAVAAGNWAGAAQESHLKDDDNPGVRPRNEANKTLFLNAQRVVDDGLDPSVLLFDGAATPSRPAPVAPSPAPAATAMFLSDDICVEYDIGADAVSGVPFRLADRWRGLDESGFDSSLRAVVTLSGHRYAFKDDLYIRLSGEAVDPDYPKPIAGNWPGLAEAGFGEDIDAAIVLTQDKAYFFKGDAYVRYDIPADRVDPEYPKPIVGNWPGLAEAGFGEDIDAAIVLTQDKAYFFKGDTYVRYDIPGDRVDADYPQPIAGNWPGLGEAGLGDGIDAAWIE